MALEVLQLLLEGDENEERQQWTQLLSMKAYTFFHWWTNVVAVTIGSPIVQMNPQVADLGSAYKLAPQSPGLPQTERLSIGVLKLILKLREVSPLAWELYTVSRKGQVTKHK